MSAHLAGRTEIASLISGLFRYADETTFVSLRTFDQFNRRIPPLFIRAVPVNGNPARLVDEACRLAQRSADHTTPTVFAPPICTFSNGHNARGEDLANGLALSVELDEAPNAARASLTQLLGPPTLVVASGGDWTDPATGELQPKQHVHWRLSEPTRTAEEHAQLRAARIAAALLVGGDPTGAPVVHPYRWPGSWNMKAKPRLARIVSHNDNAEINLGEVLEFLQDAVEAAGAAAADMPKSGKPQAPIALIRSAMAAIPNAGNDIHYNQWVRLGYAVTNATGAVPEAFDIFEAWSKKSAKFNAGETETVWRRIVAATSASSAPVKVGAGTIFMLAKAAGWKRPNDPPGKPHIPVEPGKLDVLATLAEDAIRAAGLPVFQRGGTLVRPLAWEVPASDERTVLATGFRTITEPALIDLMAQSANWTRYVTRTKKHRPIDPPPAIAAIVLSRSGLWGVPAIIGVICTPTLRKDGSVLSAPGFDAATRLYHVVDPGLRMPPVGTSRAAAERALALITDLLAGFPFVDPVDRAVALSGLISPVVRGAVGMVPLHALTAPTPGSGKSYYVDVAAAIPTGRICPVASAGRTEEETEKRLTGLLLAAFQVVSIDNLSDELGGDLLCQACERPSIRVRPLGKSDIVEIESRATIFATGNNLLVSGDMTRRTLLAHLDAHMERPEERQFQFDPVQRVISDRGAYVAACLTVVRAYLLAGCPGKLPQLASFGAWSDLVRSALVWLGRSDPAQSIQEVRRSDPVLDTLRQVLDAWRHCFGSEGRTCRHVAEAVASFDPSTGEGQALLALRSALAPVAADHGQIDAHKLGYWLRKSKDRIVDGWKFAAVGEPHGSIEWAVSKG